MDLLGCCCIVSLSAVGLAFILFIRTSLWRDDFSGIAVALEGYLLSLLGSVILAVCSLTLPPSLTSVWLYLWPSVCFRERPILFGIGFVLGWLSWLGRRICRRLLHILSVVLSVSKPLGVVVA